MPTPKPLTLQFGHLVLDLARYRALVADRPLLLSYREYALLVYLASRAGRVVTKRRLLEEGLGRHDWAGLRTLDEHIRHLKSVLERDGRRYIEDVDGTGYRFACNKHLT